MNQGKTIFSQIMDFIPIYEFQKCVKPLQRQLQNKKLYLLGSVSLYGICSTDVPGKPQRYPGMFESSAEQTLSYGHPRHHFSEYSCKRQFREGLENLC